MVEALNAINNNQLVSMIQITMIKEEDYVILFIKSKSLNDHDGYHSLGSQLIASNERLIESIRYKTSWESYNHF
jgi:hypothetical protein